MSNYLNNGWQDRHRQYARDKPQARRDKEVGIVFNVSAVKGRHLLAKKLFIFRVGLWDESLKAYDTTRTVLLSSAVASIIASVVASIVASSM
jgi:hypothetical protein